MVMATSAALLTSVGIALQRASWTARMAGSGAGTYRGTWYAGASCFVAAAMLNAVAVYVSSAMIVTALGATCIWFNGALSRCTALGRETAPPLTPERVLWMAVSVDVCVMLGSVAFWMDPAEISVRDDVAFVFITSVVCCAAVLEVRKCDDCIRLFGAESAQYADMWKWHRINYALIIALLSSASTVVEVAFERALAAASFTPVECVTGESLASLLMMGALALAFALVQLYWLNQGLARFSDAALVPPSVVLSTVWSACYTALFVRNFAVVAMTTLLCVPAVICAGAFGFSHERGPWSRHCADPDSPHAAERINLVEDDETVYPPAEPNTHAVP